MSAVGVKYLRLSMLEFGYAEVLLYDGLVGADEDQGGEHGADGLGPYRVPLMGMDAYTERYSKG